MPNQPKTPGRNFRIPDDIYDPAKARAEADGEPNGLTGVVVRFLTAYSDHRADPPTAEALKAEHDRTGTPISDLAGKTVNDTWGKQ